MLPEMIRIAVGTRVTIRPHPDDLDQRAIVGTITDTVRGVFDAKEQDLWCVKRDDGTQGVGPDGTWLVPADGVDPYDLLPGMPVTVHGRLGDQPCVVARASDAGSDYVWVRGLAHKNPEAEHLVERVTLSLRRAKAGAPAPEPVAEPEEILADVSAAQVAAAFGVEPPQPAKIDTLKSWNYDMRVPLNDGAIYPSALPNDSEARKQYPLGSVLFGQFPAAMVGLAHHSWKGNNKHNPGQDLQDNRTKSTDDLECALRHLLEGDYPAAHWRVARLHQKWCEANGAPVAPLAKFE